MTEPNPAPYVARADAQWQSFRFDVVLIAIAVACPIFSYALDIANHHADWFQRSGAVTALISAILAFRSLSRHYVKFFRNTQRGYPLATSEPQTLLDRITLALSILGTIIWAYGDKWQ